MYLFLSRIFIFKPESFAT